MEGFFLRERGRKREIGNPSKAKTDSRKKKKKTSSQEKGEKRKEPNLRKGCKGRGKTKNQVKFPTQGGKKGGGKKSLLGGEAESQRKKVHWVGKPVN